MPVDHFNILVSKEKYQEAIDLYTKALEPIGYKLLRDIPGITVGFGEVQPDFWITSTEQAVGGSRHFAFTAKDRASVAKFHELATAAGAKCNGPPGKRPYHPNYYAAYIFDTAGNNVEVCCHQEEKE